MHEQLQEDTQITAEGKSQTIIQLATPVYDDIKLTESIPLLSKINRSRKYEELYHFLTKIKIKSEDVQRKDIPESSLNALYIQENGEYSWIKWNTIDHFAEKLLHFPLLSLKDINPDSPDRDSECRYSAYAERSILLKRSWGLRKAYGVRGLIKGIETGLFKSVHYFIYAMLAYRFGNLIQSVVFHKGTMQNIFANSSQKGIDSLVRPLSKLSERQLELILCIPLFIGVLQSLLEMRGIKPKSQEEIKKIQAMIGDHCDHPKKFWRNFLIEMTPILSNMISVGAKIRNLEQRVRWDGLFDPKKRLAAFKLILKVAKKGHQITQLIALESLAKVAHGIGFSDLLRLHHAGYNEEELAVILYMKAMALQQLQKTSTHPMLRKYATCPRRIYASYLLWWLGQSDSILWQSLPFSLFKLVKLGSEAYFLLLVVQSILNAMRCPDKPGFKFGEGYLDWSANYKTECFTVMIGFFRTQFPFNDSVSDLVLEIPKYYLKPLTRLDLSSKFLSGEEAEAILWEIGKQSPPLQWLNLSSNCLSEPGIGRSSPCKESPYQYNLSQKLLSSFPNLTLLDLSYAVYTKWRKIANFSVQVLQEVPKLQWLDLSGPWLQSINETMFDPLTQLQVLKLIGSFGGFDAAVFGNNLFSRLSNLELLDLSNNDNIKTLDGTTFSVLRNLKYLNLSNHNLQTVQGPVFTNLINLQILNFNLIGYDGSYDRGYLNLSGPVFANWNLANSFDYFNCGFSYNYGPDPYCTVRPYRYLNLTGPIWSNSSVLNLNLIGVGSSTSDLETEGLYLGHDIFTGMDRLQKLNFTASTIITSEALSSTISNLSQLQILDASYSYWPLSNPFRNGTFSALSALTILNLSHSYINNLEPGMLFAGLNNLQLLNLSYVSSNYWPPLERGMFYGLSRLEVLDLSQNRNFGLTLPKELFFGLDKLRNLNLSSTFYWNEGDIESGCFSGLNELRELDLSGKEVTYWDWGGSCPPKKLGHLNYGSLSGIGNLVKLDLSKNLFSYLEKGIFEGLSSLEDLDLSRSFLPFSIHNMDCMINRTGGGEWWNTLKMDDGIFSNLTTLKKLNLSDNGFHILNISTFSGLSQLVILDLSSNYFKAWNGTAMSTNFLHLDSKLFSELTSLESINLSRNGLINISSDTFLELKQLKYLDLSAQFVFQNEDHFSYDPYVSCLEPYTFRGLATLQTLDLSNSYFNCFTPESFFGLDNLTTLDFSRNYYINLIPYGFSFLKNLKNLNLAASLYYNQESNYSSEYIFSGLDQLEFLDLSDNTLVNTSTINFNTMTNLRHLKLSGVYYSSGGCASKMLINILEKNVFIPLKNLQILDWSCSRLNYIVPGAFKDLGNLTILTLTNHELINVDNNTFIGLEKLETLDLSYGYYPINLNSGVFNGLTHLKKIFLPFLSSSIRSGIFSPLKQLEYLKTNYDQIDPGVFLGLENLNTLNLSSGQPYILNLGNFYNLTNLRVLDLSGYVSRNISQRAFTGLNNLQILNLSGNYLQYIESEAFVGLDKLTMFDLSVTRIEMLGYKALAGLPFNNTLDLSGKEIRTLEAGAFIGLEKLKILNLSNNPFSKNLGSETFMGLSQLEILDLSQPTLKADRYDVSRLTKLTAAMFIEMPKLKFLNLSYLFCGRGNSNYDRCIDSTIERNTFLGINELIWLDLSGNKWSGNAYDYQIINLTIGLPYSLQYLDLSRINIGESGIEALSNLLNCRPNLTIIYGSPQLELLMQKNALKKVCADESCHTYSSDNDEDFLCQPPAIDLMPDEVFRMNPLTIGSFFLTQFSRWQRDSSGLSLTYYNEKESSTDQSFGSSFALTMLATIGILGMGWAIYKKAPPLFKKIVEKTAAFNRHAWFFNTSKKRDISSRNELNFSR